MKLLPVCLPAETLDRVRSFNRFYTRLLGLFEPRFLGHDLCLTEARVLYEIHRRGSCRARDLLADLDLDRGYLSRLLGTFETRGWVARDREARDRRLRNLSLTSQGEELVVDLERRARQQAADLLEPLAEEERAALLEAMGCIEALLAPSVRGAEGTEG